MKSFVRNFLQYNHASNEKVISLMEKHIDEVPEKCIALFSHILNAQEIWNARILGKQPKYKVWDVSALAEFRYYNQTFLAGSIAILEEFNLELKIDYHTSKGDPFTSSVQDILIHMVNHGSYHRGQIMQLLRNEVNDAISTDYIFYSR